MKTFLNVLGILSLLGAVALFFQRGAGALLAGAAIAEAGLFFGLAKLIELAQAQIDQAKARHDLERDFWKLQATARPTKELPPPPGKERWFIVFDGEVNGPHTTADLEKFLAKGTIDRDCPLATEGAAQWRPLREVLTET